MTMKHSRVAAFYDVVRELTYTEMVEIADEVSAFIQTNDEITGRKVAAALVEAADGKPTNKQTTREA